MLDGSSQKSNKNTSRLFKSLSAYVINREKTVGETPPAKEKSPAEPPVATEEHKPDPHKQLDVQVLIGEVERLLNSMDQADARVQRTLAKLYELKTAILVATSKQ